MRRANNTLIMLTKVKMEYPEIVVSEILVHSYFTLFLIKCFFIRLDLNTLFCIIGEILDSFTYEWTRFLLYLWSNN